MKRIIALMFTVFGAFTGAASAQSGPHIIEAAPRVMVFPFTPTGDPGTYHWIGTGIQQSLLVEVNRPGSMAWSMPAVRPPTTEPSNFDPQAEAARAGASLAVFGNYQIQDNQVRVTGEAVDTGSGKVLAALKATGAVRDLFKVEDELDGQLQGALPHPQPQVGGNFLNDEQPTAAPAPSPAVVENDVQVVQPDYGYADTYGLPYPYYDNYGIYGGFSGAYLYGGYPYGRGYGYGGYRGDHHRFGVGPVIGHPVDRGFGSVGLTGGVGGISAGFGYGRGYTGGGFRSGAFNAGGGSHGGFGGGRR